MYFTVLGDSPVMPEVPQVMSRSDVHVSFVLVPEIQGLLPLGIMMLVRRRQG